MSDQPQLFRIDPESRQSEVIAEVGFVRLGFQERRDIQEWVAANLSILGQDLLIVGKEFSGFDHTDERLDLLAVDSDGILVIIELKRDDTGADTHWQAIKYASYFHRATADVIVRMAAEYWGDSEENSFTRLLEHLGADDLNGLNKDQRIILASHRFAPVVTTAALWLNQKGLREDLITCVKLTPYQDLQTAALYVQASTIIPVPGVDDYLVGVGQRPQLGSGRANSSFAANLQKAYARNKDDEVTQFFRKVRKLATEGLPDEIKPNKTSRWGAGWPARRYYRFWYSRPPWSNSGLSYQVTLSPQTGDDGWLANIELRHCPNNSAGNFPNLDLPVRYLIDQDGITADVGAGQLNDEFAGRIAEVVRKCIEKCTPVMDDLENETDESQVTA